MWSEIDRSCSILQNMLMAAVAYNLKKYMKFESKLIAAMTKEAKNPGLELLFDLRCILGSMRRLNLFGINTPNFKACLKPLILSCK